MKVLVKLIALLAVAALVGTSCSTSSSPQSSSSQGPVDVRVAAIVGAGQGVFSTAMKDAGIDKKYNLNLLVVPISTTGEQWNALRSGAADVAGGSFLDLLRQRKAGLQVRAFVGFQRYINPILVPAGSSIRSFKDLAGKRIGTPSANLLDFMIVRAAGKKAYDLDVGKDATVVPAAPNLLNELLQRGQIDAALQFESLAIAPVKQGKLRRLTDVPKLMAAASFDPEAFYTSLMVTDKWVNDHPGAVDRLAKAIKETFALEVSDNSVWEPLLKQVGITDPEVGRLYVQSQRDIQARRYDKSLIAPTDELLTNIIQVVGQADVGVTQLDENAFLFPAA